MKRLGRWSLAAACVTCTAALGLIACSGDDNTTSTPTPDSGANAADSNAPDSNVSNPDTGASDAGTTTLFQRLGGDPGITSAVGSIVGAELKDPDIASYFAPNLQEPSHTPQPGDIETCLVILLDSVSGGPQTYPPTAALDSGFSCRTMADAHQALHIGNGTFDNFVTIAAGVLAAAPYNVGAADLATIGGVLEGTKSAIVDPAAPDGGPCEASACQVPPDSGP